MLLGGSALPLPFPLITADAVLSLSMLCSAFPLSSSFSPSTSSNCDRGIVDHLKKNLKKQEKTNQALSHQST